MTLRTRTARLAGLALLCASAAHLFAADAMAAKEKFDRTKPHVNVGTIGEDQPEPNQLTGNAGGSAGGAGASQSLDPSANDCQQRGASDDRTSC